MPFQKVLEQKMYLVALVPLPPLKPRIHQKVLYCLFIAMTTMFAVLLLPVDLFAFLFAPMTPL
jgi:hypothetical protein